MEIQFNEFESVDEKAFNAQKKSEILTHLEDWLDTTNESIDTLHEFIRQNDDANQFDIYGYIQENLVYSDERKAV